MKIIKIKILEDTCTKKMFGKGKFGEIKKCVLTIHGYNLIYEIFLYIFFSFLLPWGISFEMSYIIIPNGNPIFTLATYFGQEIFHRFFTPSGYIRNTSHLAIQLTAARGVTKIKIFFLFFLWPCLVLLYTPV